MGIRHLIGRRGFWGNFKMTIASRGAMLAAIADPTDVTGVLAFAKGPQDL